MAIALNAQSIYDSEFRSCARSKEWKAGALRGLERALGAPAKQNACPFAGGTAQADAWSAGFDAGRAEAKFQLTAAKHG